MMRQASFRDQIFHIAGRDTDHGARRVAIHEYPQRDRRYLEDLGAGGLGVDFDAFLMGPDLEDRVRNLIAACTMPGPGRLVHPDHGEWNAVCTKITEKRGTEKNYVTFQLSFQASDPIRYPITAIDHAKALEQSVIKARVVVIAGFLLVIRIQGHPAWVAANLARNVVTQMQAISDALSGLSGEAAETLAEVGAAAQTLAAAPELLAEQLAEAIDAAAAQAMQRPDGCFALLSLVEQTRNSLPQAITATRLAVERNARALALLTARLVLLAIVRHLPKLVLDAAGDVQSVIDRLADAFDQLADIASDLREDRVLAELRALSQTAIRHLAARVPTLPERIAFTLREPEPALVVAYRLTGGMDAATALVRRNRIIHPGFLPAATLLELAWQRGTTP